ncbi:MAG: 3-isopropylmalate dehydratase small subunit [Bdellovibrionales bacterium]|nr:3-isopropylmalate dehydratase small subunit [Bdellovibrionales bacterium]
MARVWRFEDDVNTDLIIPARYNQTTDSRELAQAVFCEARPEFASAVQPGDIIVAGENFGCGSSREHAAIAIKAAGVSAVIAKSFARIFHRNAVNIGLAVLECAEPIDHIFDGDEVEFSLERGEFRKLSTSEVVVTLPLPEFLQKVIRAGGIVPFLREHDVSELIA